MNLNYGEDLHRNVVPLSARVLIVAFLLILALFLGCGGGGGSSQVGPAVVRLQVDPSILDTGDRAQILLEIRDFESDRIRIKVHMPASLREVRRSGALIVADEEIDLEPSFTPANDTDRYVIFDLNRVTYGIKNTDTVQLRFLVDALSDVSEGEVEVDIDLLRRNEADFDIDAPQFTAQADASIQVGTGPTPTPSGS